MSTKTFGYRAASCASAGFEFNAHAQPRFSRREAEAEPSAAACCWTILLLVPGQLVRFSCLIRIFTVPSATRPRKIVTHHGVRVVAKWLSM